MQLKKISTRKDYNVALQRFEKIFQAKNGSKESDEADVLSVLLKDYETNNFEIKTPDPIDAILYRMEQLGLQKSDLENLIGHKSRVSDIFNRKRKLNLNMIRGLHRQLNIPLETLVKEY